MSGTKGANMPMALDPPPTQATTTSGRRPVLSRHCLRVSSPMTFWNSLTRAGNGWVPMAEPTQ